MVHILADELHAIVLRLVQADDMGDPKVSEDLEVVFWSVTSFANASRLIDRPHKGNKLVGDYPI
jgi:hypothetical protein